MRERERNKMWKGECDRERKRNSKSKWVREKDKEKRKREEKSFRCWKYQIFSILPHLIHVQHFSFSLSAKNYSSCNFCCSSCRHISISGNKLSRNCHYFEQNEKIRTIVSKIANMRFSQKVDTKSETGFDSLPPCWNRLWEPLCCDVPPPVPSPLAPSSD